jgi:hypothetical protein
VGEAADEPGVGLREAARRKLGCLDPEHLLALQGLGLALDRASEE